MQKSHDYQIDMHTDVQGVCNNNQALLATILVYLASKLKLDTNLTNERALAALLEKLEKNSATPKKMSRTAAIPNFLNLSNNLSSFAWNNGDMKLYLEVNFNITSFKSASDNEFVRICGNLITAARENIAELADRNITEQTLTADSALLEDFIAKRKIYIDAKRQRFEVTEQLTDQIRITNFDLKSIDKIINSVSQKQPILASDYWKARNLPVPTGSKLVFKGKVFDSVTGQPLIGAVMTLYCTNSMKALTTGNDLVKNFKIKSAGGGFHLKSLATGTYLMKVTYSGYVDMEVTVYINEGNLTKVELPLVQIAS